MTKLIVSTKDVRTGRTIETKLEEQNDDAPDMIDRTADGSEKILSQYKTASEVKLFLNDYSFTLITDRHFTNEAELASWATQWFRRNRENFILCRGTTVGIPTLNARQVHTLNGLGVGFSGDYSLVSVRHTFDKGMPYLCEFSGNKYIEDLPQPVNSG